MKTKKDYSEILFEAAKLAKERQAAYGEATKSVQLACDILKTTFGKELTVMEFCEVIVALKLSRQKFKFKRDNVVDSINYLAIGLSWQDQQNA